MTDQQVERRGLGLTPPPSLDDILSGGDRLVGRVDFRRLAAGDAEPEAPAAPASRRPAGLLRRSTTRPAAEAAPAAEPTASPAPEPAPEPASESTTESTPAAEAATPPEPTTAPPRTDAAPVVEATGAAPAPAPAQPVTQPAAQPVVEAVVVPTPEQPAPVAPAPAPQRATFGSTVPTEDVPYLGLSVEQVAESAIARMQAAEAAHHRYLEAVEQEAARRLELLIAQAELDAELIRLHARREAHAILSAASGRQPLPGEDADRHRMDGVADTFARFAESIVPPQHLRSGLDGGPDHTEIS